MTNVVSVGFYAMEPDQEAGSYARGGIWCFNGSTPNVQIGDLVTLSGDYVEFFFETEIDMTGGTFSVIGTAPVPPATVLNITDLNNGGSGAEPPGGWTNGEDWEGVLVRCEDADMVSTPPLATGCFSNTPSRWGMYQTSAPSESLFVRNSQGTHETPIGGADITFVEGVMTYHRCNRKVLPRDNDDVGYTGPPNVLWAFSTPTAAALSGGNVTTIDVEFSRDVEETSAETLANYVLLSGLPINGASRDDANPSIVHLTTMAQPNAVQDELFVQNIVSDGDGGVAMPAPQSFQFYTGITTIQEIQTVADPAIDDQSPYLAGVVSTIGVATTSTNNTNTSDFSIGANPAGAYTGLRVGLAGPGAEIGDLIRVSGTVVETFGRTAIDFAGFGDYVKLGTATVPSPVAFASPEFLPYADAAESEPYEDVLVRVQEAVIDTTNFWGFGEWWMLAAGAAAAPGDSAKLDHMAGGVSNDFGWEPCVGNTIAMTGILEYSFGEYKIIPRQNGDVTHLGFGPGCLVSTGEVTVPSREERAELPEPVQPDDHHRVHHARRGLREDGGLRHDGSPGAHPHRGRQLRCGHAQRALGRSQRRRRRRGERYVLLPHHPGGRVAHEPDDAAEVTSIPS